MANVEQLEAELVVLRKELRDHINPPLPTLRETGIMFAILAMLVGTMYFYEILPGIGKIVFIAIVTIVFVASCILEKWGKDENEMESE